MAVAALSTSTSALALTASPAPTPGPATASAATQAPEAPHPFAKLVERAKSDEKSSQDGAKPESSADEKTTDPAGPTGDATADPDDDDKKDLSADQPADLMAKLEAMAAAASQLAVTQPAAAAVPPTVTPVAGAAKDLTTIAAAALATSAVKATGIATSAPTTTAQLAITDDAFTDDAVVPTGQVPAPDAGTAKPETPPRGGDIAKLLASLKAAFQPLEKQPAPVDAAPAKGGTDASQQSAAAPAAAVPGPAAAAPQDTVLAAAAATAPAGSAAAAAVVSDQAPVAAAKIDTKRAVASGPVGKTPTQPSADTPAAATAPAEKPDPAATAAAAVRPAATAAITDQAAAAADRSAPSSGDASADAAAGSLPGSDPAPGTAPTAPVVAAVPLTASPMAISADTNLNAVSQADQSLIRHLDLARDNQWLDRLARDISQAATQQGQLKFQLNPEHLGALTVEIANGASGTAIRMTAETDHARTIIADAQPRLIAEVRAQGLRVAESHVDLNQQGSSSSAFAQGQQQRQPSEDSKPFTRTQTVIRDDAADSAPADDGELYA